jgi:hypothetical protein
MRFKFDKFRAIGIIFLTITLSFGIYVAINRNISLNINEKAGVDGGMDTLTGNPNGVNYGTVNGQQNGKTVSTDPVNIPAGIKTYNEATCGNKCGTQICHRHNQTNFYYCITPAPPPPPAVPAVVVAPSTTAPVSSYSNPYYYPTTYVAPTVITPAQPAVPVVTSPVVRPTLTPALKTATGGYDFQTAKNDLAAPNTAGFDFGNGEISGYYSVVDPTTGNKNYYAISGTGNNPDNYIEERLRDLQIANSIVSQELRIDRYEQSVVDTAAVEAEAAAAEQLRLAIERIDNLEQIRQSRDDQRVAEQLVQARIEQKDVMTTLLYNSSRSPQIDTNVQKCGSIYLKWEDNTCVPRDPDYIQKTEQLIADQNAVNDAQNNLSITFKDVYDFTLLGKIDNAINNPIAYNDAFFDTGVTGDIIKTAIQDMADTYTFGKFDPYIEAFQPDKIKYYWESHYDSLADCNEDFKGTSRNYCLTNDYTNDQITTSVDLGIVLTEEFAAPIAVYKIGASLAADGLISAAGTAFGQFGAMSASSQIVKAGETCVIEGKVFEWGSQCEQDAARATITLLSLGIGQAVNTDPTLTNRIANSIISAGNFVIDSGDVIDTCTNRGSNQSDFGCAMSAVALVGDVAGSYFDYNSNQLLTLDDITPNLASLNNTDGFGGWPIENIPNVANPRVDVSTTAQTDLAVALAEDTHVDVPEAVAPTARRTFSQWVEETIYQPIADSLLDISPDLNRIADTETVKVDVPEADTPIVKVDPAEPEPVGNTADNNTQSQSKGATTLAGNLVEGFQNIGNNITEVLNTRIITRWLIL